MTEDNKMKSVHGAEFFSGNAARHLVEKFPIMEPIGSLTCLQKRTTCLYSGPDEFSFFISSI
jgi:hypothetical protein